MPTSPLSLIPLKASLNKYLREALNTDADLSSCGRLFQKNGHEEDTKGPVLFQGESCAVACPLYTCSLDSTPV